MSIYVNSWHVAASLGKDKYSDGCLGNLDFNLGHITSQFVDFNCQLGNFIFKTKSTLNFDDCLLNSKEFISQADVFFASQGLKIE